MRRVIVGVMMVLFVTSVAMAAGPGPAIDPPAWWDNPAPPNPTWKQNVGTQTNTNDLGSGTLEGTLTAFLPNEEELDKYKLWYCVVEFETDDPDVVYSPSPAKLTYEYESGAAFVLDVPDNPDGRGPGNDQFFGHYEFGGLIDPQPTEERLDWEFSELHVDKFISLQFDFRSICFDRPGGGGGIPEPGALALVAGGLLGLVRRKRS